MSELVLDGNAQSVVTEILKIVDAAVQVEKAGRKLVDQSKEQANEERRLARLRKQLLDESITGSERARQKLEDFNRAVRGQAVDEEKVARVRRQLIAEYVAAKNEETGATARAAQAEKDRSDKLQEQADEERRLAAARDRYFTQYQSNADRVKAKIEEFNRSLKGVKGREEEIAQVRRKLHNEYVAALAKDNEGLIEFREELDEVEETGRDAFDGSKIVAWGASFLGVQQIISQTLQVIKGVRTEVDQLGDKLDTFRQSSGNLVQLAGADAGLRDRLFAASDEVYAAGLVKSREEADKLIFELQSAGRLSEVGFFKRLSAIDDATSVAKSIGTITSAFKGIDAVGSSADLYSKTLAAANPAVGVDGAQIAAAVAEVAGAAKAFALRDEELFAAISVSSEQTGDASTSASNIRQLLVSAARQGLADELRGQGLAAIISRVEKEGTTDKDLVKFLGDIQGIQGFRQLQDQRRVERRLREIERAQGSGLAEDTIINALASDRIRASQIRQRAENEAEISRDRQAIEELYADAGQRLFVERGREQYGDAYAYVDNLAKDFGRTFISGTQAEFAEAGRYASQQSAQGERAAADERIRLNALAQSNNPEERFYAQQRQRQAQESAAFAERELARQAAEQAEKTAKKEETEQRRIVTAELRAEAQQRRQEGDALRQQRERSEFARVSRETSDLARRAGVGGFDAETAVDRFRAERPDESAGRTDTEILREVAGLLRDQLAETKRQNRQRPRGIPNRR